VFDSVEAFGQRLATLLEVDVDGVSPYDDLFADWGLDSLQAFQMVVTIEGMAEVAVPPPEIPEMFTVGDAYAYYRSLRASRAG
jgi:acyl carrier protein